jgi:hypothetical protein
VNKVPPPPLGIHVTRHGIKTCLQLFLVFLLASATVAADRDLAKYSDSADKNAKSKRQAILAEIKQLGDHEWAGEYYAGDGLGMNTPFVIAPKSGYVFEWHGCVGLYDRNYGTATLTNGRIHLSFTFENQQQGFQGIAREFIPVSWGSRRYLIPADDIVGFCNNFNEGREPRDIIHGSYLLRRGDEQKKVTGFPKVPKEYEPYLLAKPIEATITEVRPYTTRPSIIDFKFKDTTVIIDAGTKQGLRVGMELTVTQPRDAVNSLRITKVENTRSEAVMTQAGEDEPGPKKGWRLSTQAPWKVKQTK